MLQIPRIISNKSLNIEEYSSVKIDCLLEQRQLVAWRINFRYDNIYRYYYMNPSFRNQFLQSNEDKPRDITFENSMQTIIVSNVRQWINNIYENIECVMYNKQINLFERRVFYLNIYVSPFLFSVNINNIPMKTKSIFSFSDKQKINLICEIYSYPKSTLQIRLNNQIIRVQETIDCFNDDLSTILLSDSLCLSQTNWRIRVRINTTLYLTEKHNKQNLICSVINFPYGNSWNYSSEIQFLESIGKKYNH
ncbi:unnamed protein product [Adineta steineri]|uniref:Uncharacterized protein n=1 Tax=Adineta steineri TaxID=433720 RepID=A0A818XLY6_9BILA|nr:unnamed protein product [Adineta steineri]CAF3742414.1 unnamed protein product [Adineta steineri]